MLNKYTFFGGVAVIGIFAIVIGAWAKIMHRAYADLFLTIGLFAEGIGIAALVWFIFMRQSKANSK